MKITEENKEPMFQIIGSILSKNGFNVGDFVHVVFSENQIIINKDEKTDTLSKMAETNPTILKIIKDFDLDILVA